MEERVCLTCGRLNDLRLIRKRKHDRNHAGHPSRPMTGDAQNHTGDQAGLDAAIAAHIEGGYSRVSRFEYGGQHYWLKRPERGSIRMRLQKGNALAKFNAERVALKELCAQGLPFSPLVAEGVEYFVTKDGGPPLMAILRKRLLPTAERAEAFAMAGQVLAQMHIQGFSHGRPSIKDICWKNSTISLLDLEYYTPERNNFKGHVYDLILFLHSAFAAIEDTRPEIDAAIRAYREHDTKDVWAGARRWCLQRRLIDPLTRPIQWLPTRHVRDFRAIPLLFTALAETP